MRPTDPRIRANLNRLHENLESAAETTQSYLYTFTSRAEPYVTSCLDSLSTCLEASCQPCFASLSQQRRRQQQRGRHHRHRNALTASGGGRMRGAGGRDGGIGIGGFDFYDDWEEQLMRQEEEEEFGGEVGWGSDELERLLSGDDGDGEEGGLLGQQPLKRKVGMSYGTGYRSGGGGGGKRKGMMGDEPNVVPQSSMFGFLESLPWKIGGRGSGRFKPGVADLQEGVGRKGASGRDAEVEAVEGRRKGRRSRSGTVESRSTTNSLSSRGDLFRSDDDEADAVPLDDEFAMGLDRRNTAASDEQSSGRRGGGRKRTVGSTKSSTKTGSSKNTRGSRRKGRRDSSMSSRVIERREEATQQGEEEAPSIIDLKMEEERTSKEEDARIEERRVAARKLARERGFTDPEAGGMEAHLDDHDDDSKEVTSTVALTTDIPPPSPEMRDNVERPDGGHSEDMSPEHGARKHDP